MRIVIAGVPRTGKTTLSTRLGVDTVRHLDDLIATHAWSEASEAASRYFDEPGPWVVEGVQSARALRKWLARNHDGKPCDVVYLMMSPRMALTRGQATMAKGVATVWDEIAGEPSARGVAVMLA